jgi:hypothetical protein
LFPWIFIAFLGVSQQGMFKNTTNKIAGHFPQPKKVVTYLRRFVSSFTADFGHAAFLAPDLPT